MVIYVFSDRGPDVMNSGPLIDSSTLPTRLMELLKDEGSVRYWRVNFTDSVAFFEDNYICFWLDLKFWPFPPNFVTLRVGG